jgi:Raf kinase inhibitor-like YbhB/YbcL family protein
VILASLTAALVLTSPAFTAGGTIPARYTCDGANVSPPLRWTAPPAGTRSFSLGMVDVTARFVHWRASGLPPGARALRAGAKLPRERLNSFGRRGYGGPCPPAGAPHRYVFTLSALGPHGRVLGRASLAGRYGR